MLTRSGTTTAVWLALGLAAGATAAELPHLGKPFDEASIAAWDISIAPNGIGLPPGAGTPAQGARIYAEKCALCHGPEGKGGVAGVTAAPLPPLVGGEPDHRHLGCHEEDRQFLALLYDTVRLHPAGDAMATTDDAHQRRGVWFDRLYSGSEQADR